MSFRSTSVVKILLIVTMVTALYNSCGPVHHKGKGAFALSGECAGPLKQVFSDDYHPFLQNNCNTCHVVGGQGKGYFSEDNFELAFEAFMNAGQKSIHANTVGNHKPPYTGPQHNSVAESMKSKWLQAEAEFNSCNSNKGGGPVNPNLATIAKQIDIGNNTKTMSWDLGSEMVVQANQIPGATFSIRIRRGTNLATPPQDYYELFEPVLDASGTSDAVRVAYVAIYLNGQEIGSTWLNVDVTVKQGESQQIGFSALQEEGVNIQSTDTLTIYFGILALVNFNPPTFQQLQAQVFNSCTGCHNSGNPAGTLDMSSYNAIMNDIGMIVPGVPQSSEIYKRMTDQGNPMPTGGLLPVSQRDMVRDWILDGAPNN